MRDMVSTSLATLPRAPQAVRAGRSLLWTSFESWGCDRTRLPDAAAVLSELVTNAVRHGAGDVVRLTLRRTSDVLTISVGDGSPLPPRLRAAAPDDEGGRGMAIVASLAHRWGHEARADGKVVWAAVRC